MGSFSRLRYVIAANVNSLLEKAEDPEKLLRALIRDMEDATEDARLASADLLAEHGETVVSTLIAELPRLRPTEDDLRVRALAETTVIALAMSFIVLPLLVTAVTPFRSSTALLTSGILVVAQRNTCRPFIAGHTRRSSIIS